MVGVIDTYIHYPLGSRIKVGNNCGTIKYVGEVFGHSGQWLGIEWDDPCRGKHNGSIDGNRYFLTQYPTSGSFVRPEKISEFESLEESIRNRYLDYSENIVDETLLLEAQKTFQASFIEIVGMDKIARKQSKFEELTDISVDGCPVNTVGYLKDFTMLTTLNLSHTLVWNWETIADIVKQVPTLCHLDLSHNRILVPTGEDIIILEPAFRNLQHINLGNCGITEWKDVIQIAHLWPNILYLGLQENPIRKLHEINRKEIFKQIRELDLHSTKIMDFDQICKLSNLDTLKSLNLMENNIEEINLPDCDPNVKLKMFTGLEQLNLQMNPIWNEIDAFNELDKLPKLKRLSKTPHLKSDFEEMFSNAIGTIINLEVLNKIRITAEERRGAEYDIWKKYATEWIVASKTSDTLKEFYRKHRSYATIIAKYGSPAEFVPGTMLKRSNLIKIRVLNKTSGEIWEKRVPRMITVQTLQGLIVKQFHVQSKMGSVMPCLSYIDAKHPELIVPLDNPSKILDFYSVQENDTVLVEW